MVFIPCHTASQQLPIKFMYIKRNK